MTKHYRFPIFIHEGDLFVKRSLHDSLGSCEFGIMRFINKYPKEYTKGKKVLTFKVSVLVASPAKYYPRRIDGGYQFRLEMRKSNFFFVGRKCKV